MKKIFLCLLVLVALFLNVTILSAKTADDVACFYKIMNPLGEYMTDAQVQIIDYKGGSGGRIVVFFKDTSGKYVNYADTGVTLDWLNYNKTDSYGNVYLRFFTTDSKGKTFIANYKTSGKCPAIYSNFVDTFSSIDVENHVLDQENGNSTSKVSNPTNEQLRVSGGNWQSVSDFYKDDGGNSNVKDDLVCSYDMEFDMYNIKSPVEFRTMYNPSDGSKSYKISINGSGWPQSNLEEDVFINLAQGGSSIVYISSAEQKKIFQDGTCLDRTKVYHYYDMSYSRYTITTDAKEASENGAGGRYDNGDGSNDGQAGGSENYLENPNFNFNDSPMTCDGLLGSNIIKVIKAAITLVRIGATIATIVIGMTTFLPALTKGDAGEFNKAIKKCIWLVVVLMLIILFPVLLRTVGNLFNWDLCGLF